jgi:hypothetical protein
VVTLLDVGDVRADLLEDACRFVAKHGREGMRVEPSMKCRSEWHSPAQAVRNSTSRGPGLRTPTSSMTRGLFTSCSKAAFMPSRFLISDYPVLAPSRRSYLVQAQSVECLGKLVVVGAIVASGGLETETHALCSLNSAYLVPKDSKLPPREV